MTNSRDYQGRLLISNTDGKNLGEVKDVYLSNDATQAKAVFLGKTGLINRKAQLIDWNKIALFGIDALLIAGSDTVIPQNEWEGGDALIPVGDLNGREIQTDGGSRIAIVGDAILDEQGKVLGFTLDKIFAEGPLSQRKTIARGAIFSLGDRDKPMITVLEQAETMAI